MSELVEEFRDEEDNLKNYQQAVKEIDLITQQLLTKSLHAETFQSTIGWLNEDAPSNIPL